MSGSQNALESSQRCPFLFLLLLCRLDNATVRAYSILVCLLGCVINKWWAMIRLKSRCLSFFDRRKPSPLPPCVRARVCVHAYVRFIVLHRLPIKNSRKTLIITSVQPITLRITKWQCELFSESVRSLWPRLADRVSGRSTSSFISPHYLRRAVASCMLPMCTKWPYLKRFYHFSERSRSIEISLIWVRSICC